MNSDCQYGHYQYGRYIISKSVREPERLIAWIGKTGFREFEQPAYDLKKPCRPRNSLYTFRHPETAVQCVMKVSQINPKYKVARKIDLFLTGLYKDYAEVSFHGAQALHNCGISVVQPLAFWTFRKNIFNKKSYFLCERAPGEQTLSEWLKQPRNSPLSNKVTTIIAEKIVDIARQIHDCCWRHGDIHTGNIQIHIPQSSADGDIVEQAGAAQLYLLDYDSCSCNRIHISWLKRFFDFRDLRNLQVLGIDDEQWLTIYLRDVPTSRQRYALEFWKRGGFDVRKQLGLGRSRKNRHLKS